MYVYMHVCVCVCMYVGKGSAPRLFLSSLFFKRFLSARRRRFFVRQWGTRGVVACVVHGRSLVYL